LQQSQDYFQLFGVLTLPMRILLSVENTAFIQGPHPFLLSSYHLVNSMLRYHYEEYHREEGMVKDTMSICLQDASSMDILTTTG